MRRGFTLIELLVVMAIISILASILFPVFSKAIDKAKGTACLSNVKQLQLAVMMYASDYDGSYPTIPVPGGAATWDQAIFPYTQNRQIAQCPTLQGVPLGYAMNFWMNGPGGANAKKSSEKVTFADAKITAASAAQQWYMFPVGVADPVPAWGLGVIPDNRHREGANYGFADGHAKWSRVEAQGVADYAIGWDPNQ